MDYISQIKKCIYDISLPKLNELQAKNRKRKILAFINPIGGKGNALTLWENISKYNEQTKIFNESLEQAKRESIFEFSIISLVIKKREDFDKFKQERKKCPNRIDRLLFHGTSIHCILNILTGLFKISEKRSYQYGKGVFSLIVLIIVGIMEMIGIREQISE